MNELQGLGEVLSTNYYSYVTLFAFNIIGYTIETNKPFSAIQTNCYTVGRMIIERE
jgi:hypothetical protein